MALRIQPGAESPPTVCECCGNESRCVWGCIQEGERIVAVYFVHWTLNTRKHLPNIDFLMGNWNDDTARDKIAISWVYNPTHESGGNYVAIDSQDRPVAKNDLCSVALTREQVVSNKDLVGLCGQMFELIWAQDQRVQDIQQLAKIQ